MIDVNHKTIISIWEKAGNYKIIVELIRNNKTYDATELITHGCLLNNIKSSRMQCYEEYESYQDKYHLKTLAPETQKPLISTTLYGYSGDLNMKLDNYSSIFFSADCILDRLGYYNYYRPNNPYSYEHGRPYSYFDFFSRLSEIKLTQLKMHPETNIEEPYYQTKIIQRINKRFIAAHGITLVGEIGAIVFSSILLSVKEPIDFGVPYIHEHYHTIASTVGGCLIALSVISFFALNVFYFDAVTFKEYVTEADTTFEDVIENNNQTTHVQI